MADGQHGGYRQPAHPAAASGPGALSQRTDGGPTQAPMLADGGPYGSRTDMANIQSGSPLAGGGGMSAASLPAIDAPSARPNEPVTAGADAGPGIGMAAAGIGTPGAMTAAQLQPLMSSLELVANLPGSTPETRSFVRNLKARLSNG